MSFNLNDVIANYKDESDFRVIDGVPRNFSAEMVYERRIKGRHSAAGIYHVPEKDYVFFVNSVGAVGINQFGHLATWDCIPELTTGLTVSNFLQDPFMALRALTTPDPVSVLRGSDLEQSVRATMVGMAAVEKAMLGEYRQQLDQLGTNLTVEQLSDLQQGLYSLQKKLQRMEILKEEYQKLSLPDIYVRNH